MRIILTRSVFIGTDGRSGRNSQVLFPCSITVRSMLYILLPIWKRPLPNAIVWHWKITMRITAENFAPSWRAQTTQKHPRLRISELLFASKNGTFHTNLHSPHRKTACMSFTADTARKAEQSHGSSNEFQANRVRFWPHLSFHRSPHSSTWFVAFHKIYCINLDLSA